MKYFTSMLFCFIFFTASAQDFQYTQWQLSPLNVNPALTGEEAKGRVGMNFYYDLRAFSAGGNSSVEFPGEALMLYFDKAFQLKNGDQIGFGVKASEHDAYSFSETMSLQSSLLFSYRKNISGANNRQFISAGLEAGLRNTRIYQRDYTHLNSDLNFGISYLADFEKIKGIRAGIGIYNFGNSYFGELNVYPFVSPRFAFHSEMTIPVSKKSSLKPRFLLNFQNSQELFYSLGLEQKINENLSFEFGSGARLTNSWYESFNHREVNFMVGISYKEKCFFAFSRNMHVGNLRTTLDREAFDLNMIYTIK